VGQIWLLFRAPPDGSDDGDGTVNVRINPEGYVVLLLLAVSAVVFVGAGDCAGQHHGLVAEVAEG